MITLSELTQFFGWASIINISYLLIATLTMMFMRETVISLHGLMFDMEEKDLESKYFDFLSNYKIVTLVFFVAPYIALKIVSP